MFGTLCFQTKKQTFLTLVFQFQEYNIRKQMKIRKLFAGKYTYIIITHGSYLQQFKCLLTETGPSSTLKHIITMTTV